MYTSASTRAASETWKLMPGRRSQRRPPFTTWPRPGISTSSSSTPATISSGRAQRSMSAIGMAKISVASASPAATSSSWRSR
jgi:hypothetical protein